MASLRGHTPVCQFWSARSPRLPCRPPSRVRYTPSRRAAARHRHTVLRDTPSAAAACDAATITIVPSGSAWSAS
ncbi:MAG: hypothetical protein ACRDMV_10065 [Streptosporangiales bacterium]